MRHITQAMKRDSIIGMAVIKPTIILSMNQSNGVF